jgi:hypothetical protein
MQTKTLTLVTYRTLDPVEIQVPEEATCALCQNPAVGGMVFPEPYELEEDNFIHGNVLLCTVHIDELTIDSKPF